MYHNKKETPFLFLFPLFLQERYGHMVKYEKMYFLTSLMNNFFK
jgi:hypothetical protein